MGGSRVAHKRGRGGEPAGGGVEGAPGDARVSGMSYILADLSPKTTSTQRIHTEDLGGRKSSECSFTGTGVDGGD